MLKNLLIKIVGKELAKKWNLQNTDIVPAPGATLISVPWYRSKSKVGFIVFMVITILKYGPPVFGHQAIDIPPQVLDFLQQLGLGLGAYGLRDALKQVVPPSQGTNTVIPMAAIEK